MKWEIRRIEPIRAANIASLFNFIMFAVIALPMFFLVGATPQPPNADPAQQEMAKKFMRMFMLAYPFFGAIVGWLMAALGAVIYNALSPRMGGVVLEVGEAGPRASGSVA